MVPAGEVERFPVIAAEGDVGRGRRAVHDAAELFAGRVHDPDPAGAAAIDIALDVDLHAVGHARLVAAQIGKDAVGLLRERAVGHQVEGADVAAARIVDVEHLLVRREGEAVGHDKVADQQRHRAEIGRDAIHAGEGQVPLLGRGGAGPRVGEVDAAVGLDHDVIGPVELPPLKAVGDHRDAAVEFLPRDPPGVVLAGDQPALKVAGQPVGPVGRFLEQRHALAGLVFHPLVVVDVAEQQIAAFLPPERSFGRALRRRRIRRPGAGWAPTGR